MEEIHGDPIVGPCPKVWDRISRESTSPFKMPVLVRSLHMGLGSEVKNR